MSLPFTAYLGRPLAEESKAQFAAITLTCDECGATPPASDGRIRLFPYGDPGVAAVSFMVCPKCDAPMVHILAGDDEAEDLILERLEIESQPDFDPAALERVRTGLTEQEVAEEAGKENGALERIDCPHCLKPIPVMVEDFVDARREYPDLPGRVLLFSGPCPWCDRQVLQGSGDPEAVEALDRIVKAEGSGNRIHNGSGDRLH